MEKKKGFSILKIFIVIVCLAAIISSVVTNVAFSNDKIPSILGRYIYVVDKKDNMGTYVSEGSALIAKDAKKQTITNGQIVICKPADETNNSGEYRLREIINADTVNDKYGTKDAAHIDKGGEDGSGTISKKDILAVCSGYPESKDLGAFIRFTTSIKGILLLLILPCIVLVALLIAKIASSKDDDDDENFDFYEYDEEAGKAPQVRSHVKSGNPLFEANQEIQPSDELERKKMSIAENFSQKKVNPDSPYQKEKERTVQFRAQRSAESTFAAKNVGGSSSTAPTADALREEMLRKTAEAERTGSFSVKAAEDSKASIPDNTGILSKTQLAEMSKDDIPRSTPLRSQSAAPASAKKPATPDITDILRKTDTAVSKKKPVSDMSVDDLLQLIENEKKKL
ncbi:hypothetical protein [uncultured Ruminococcus sp.]|uniref:hypothetical protein n=1 Tax=uncultured Ruminococcus sp. TaxID=165186 RepID=UPI0026394904|nr:hypothetical protein [uncultured Ruminococcus sp.]